MHTLLSFLSVRSKQVLLSGSFAFCSLLVCFWVVPSILHAQTPCACGDIGTKSIVTNAGQEFLLCFDQNELPQYTDSSHQNIFLACLDQPAVVTITSKQYPSFSKVFTMAANASLTYEISDDVDPLINSDEVVDNTVIHVVSTAPIVCYGLNHKLYTSDAFLALPSNVAGTEYRVMSYYNSTTQGTLSGASYQSEFSVAAFQDNTQVTITPTALTAGGKAAGVPQSYTLNAGQCVQIQADQNTLMLDLSGSIVQSNNPVVVYGAHVRAEVPVGYQIQGTTSRNMLCEQLAPISTWGKAFVCTSFAGRSAGDIARILALNDNTVLTIDGTPRITLAAGKWYDTIIKGPVAMETSQPALAGMISHTASTLQGLGDPFLAIAPPVVQTYHDFTFFTSQDPAFTLNVVIVVTERSGVGKITLDGQIIPDTSFTPIATPLNGMNWSIAQVALSSSGGHRITTTNDDVHGFTILAYGLGRVDAYGYTAGALLKPITGILATSGNQRGITQGSVVPNTINVRNILAHRVYLDSARIVLDGDAGKYYSAKFTQDVATDIKHLEMGEDATLTVEMTPPITEPIMGTFKIYPHTAQWFDLEPRETRIKILPVAAASVDGKTPIATQSFSSNFPNPFADQTTISFSLPSRADVSLKVYDDLGRVVSTLVNGEIAAGPYAMRFESRQLPNGHYTYELKSEKLSISERHSIVLVR
jgi:hypothetical protein